MYFNISVPNGNTITLYIGGNIEKKIKILMDRPNPISSIVYMNGTRRIEARLLKLVLLLKALQNAFQYGERFHRRCLPNKQQYKGWGLESHIK